MLGCFWSCSFNEWASSSLEVACQHTTSCQALLAVDFKAAANKRTWPAVQDGSPWKVTLWKQVQLWFVYLTFLIVDTSEENSQCPYGFIIGEENPTWKLWSKVYSNLDSFGSFKTFRKEQLFNRLKCNVDIVQQLYLILMDLIDSNRTFSCLFELILWRFSTKGDWKFWKAIEGVVAHLQAGLQWSLLNGTHVCCRLYLKCPQSPVC